MTRAHSTGSGHRHRQQTCCSTGVVASKDYISIAPLHAHRRRGGRLRLFPLRQCGDQLPVTGGPETVFATGVVAGEVFFGVTLGWVPALVTASRHAYWRRVGNFASFVGATD